MKQARAIVTLISVILLAGGGAQAADGSSAWREWVTFAVGGGDVRGGNDHLILERATLLMAGNVGWGRNAVSLRYSMLGFSASDGDLAIQIHRLLLSRDIDVTVGAGAGLLYCRFETSTDGPDDEFFDRVGAAWSIEAVSHTTRPVAVGATVFGAVAGSRSFTGMGIVLRVGR